jgi:hypothetical protein
MNPSPSYSTSQKRCGINTRDVNAVFTHIDIKAFNAACDKFCRERIPGFAERQDFHSQRTTPQHRRTIPAQS